jgi:hypothetical protein
MSLCRWYLVVDVVSENYGRAEENFCIRGSTKIFVFFLCALSVG